MLHISTVTVRRHLCTKWQALVRGIHMACMRAYLRSSWKTGSVTIVTCDVEHLHRDFGSSIAGQLKRSKGTVVSSNLSKPFEFDSLHEEISGRDVIMHKTCRSHAIDVRHLSKKIQFSRFLTGTGNYQPLHKIHRCKEVPTLNTACDHRLPTLLLVPLICGALTRDIERLLLTCSDSGCVQVRVCPCRA